MDPNSEIHEISSDEDGTWDEGSDDNLDWISELLDPDGGETEDSDDVVFMGEIQISKPTDRVKPVSGDVFDDDCTILETDPDNPVAVENDSADGSDELLIVGEKGQLACRDYPHPRHLCAKFPFSSTPHDKYCDLCHCYVCDSHAPCSYWGTGVCTTDHCHSNDKEEKWKLQRKIFKQGILPSTPGQKLPNNTLPMMPALPNQTPAFNPLQLPNSGSVTHSVYSPSLSACSSTASFGVPSIIGHRSNQCPGLTLNRNRCPQNLSRSSLMPGTHNLIRRERNEIVGALGPQFTTQRFKRVGSAPTVFPMNQHGYGSSNSRNSYKSHPLKNQHPLVLLNDDINVSWQDILAGSDPNFDSCESNSQPNTGSNFAEFQLYTTAQTHVYSQHIPQSVGDQNLDQHENPAPVAVNPSVPSVPDFNSVWMDGSTQGAKHSTSEASQIQGVQPISDLLNDQSFYQNESLPVSASNPHYTGIPNPVSSDLENWLSSLDYDESDSGIAKDSMPCELDFVPLQPSPVEPAMLYYDMESSWNLAHV